MFFLPLSLIQVQAGSSRLRSLAQYYRTVILNLIGRAVGLRACGNSAGEFELRGVELLAVSDPKVCFSGASFGAAAASASHGTARASSAANP